MRLDLFLVQRHDGLSRSQIQRAVEEGRVRVNGCQTKTGHRLRTGDRVDLNIPPPRPSGLLPEAMALNILYEDAWLLVLDKPAGLVVHPAAGHHGGTLVNGLLHHCRDLSGIGGVLRPGIVHRLDKDTSGLMVVAKTDSVHRALSDQFKARRVTKTYSAIVHGDMIQDAGRVDLPIGRHPVERQRMSIRSRRGKEAVTRWEVRERFDAATLLDVLIETGRTHQIRVHLHAIGHPVVGDPVYGKGKGSEGTSAIRGRRLLPPIRRQALHSRSLRFFHPERLTVLEFTSPLPTDMADLCAALRGNG